MARPFGPGQLDSLLGPFALGLGPEPAPNPAADPARGGGIYQSEVGVGVVTLVCEFVEDGSAVVLAGSALSAVSGCQIDAPEHWVANR